METKRKKLKIQLLTNTSSERATALPHVKAQPAAVEIASTELARKINRDVILRLVRSMQPIARVDLARASGLQNSTVSSLVEQLLAEGWIREGDALVTARGRRPTQISLNDRLSMLVADIQPGKAKFGVVDLNGQVLAYSEVKMPIDVEEGVRKLGTAMQHMREIYPERQFEGAGVCLPGRVDVESGRLMVAPNLRWREFDIRQALSEMLSMPVEMENDANACLLSELWFGHLDGVRNAVLLAISEGLGASILADGLLISGRRGMAGEFGHIGLDPKGPRCNCGRQGCWEVFASSRAAMQHYNKSVPATRTIASYDELGRLALAGDASARIAIELQATAVGRGLRLVTASLEPEVILFAGEITSAWSIVEPIIQRECEASLLVGQCPRIVCAGDSSKAHILGAAAVVLQRHAGYFSTHMSSSRKL